MAHQGFFTAPLLSLAIAAPIVAQAPPPAAPSWTGWAQCQLTVHAPGYSHRETHLWTITGAGTANANMEIYPTSWTVTGGGSLQRVNGPTTVSAQWTVNGTLQNVTIGATRHLDRITVQRWTNHGPARSGLTGTEISTTNGAARSRPVILDVQQWAFPAIETGTASTRATGSNSLPFDGLRGPMNPPSGAMGTAACTWDFARGGVLPSAAPASAATTPTTTPSSTAPVSGGPGSAPSSGATAPAPVGGSSSGNAGAGGTSADLYVDAQPTATPEVDTGVLVAFAFGNSGGSVNGAVVKVVASGMLVGDVTCSIFNRGACLETGSVPVAQATAGFTIPTLPAGTGLIMVNGLVTARSGAPVSVTLTITPPAGVSDPNPANNSYTMTATAVAPAQAGAVAGGSGGGGGPAVVTAGGGGAGLAIQMSADLASYVETAGTPGSWPANGNAAYNLKVHNAGPHAADGATITVPASPGLRKWMASCAQFRGPSWNLPVARIESGFVIPTLAAGDFFECVISAIVTGTAGSHAALTVTATVPSGVEDPNPGNNSTTHTLPIR